MAASEALADAILGWLKGNAFPAPPVTNLYLSLHEGEPGPAGTANDVTTTIAGGRATLPLADIGSISTAAEGGKQMATSAVVTFTGAALAGGVVSHVGLWSAAPGGTFYGGGIVPLPVTVLAGDIVRIPVASLRVLVKGYIAAP